MRILAVAAAVCLCLLPMAGGFAATTPAPPSPAAPPASDAAAKHAKRTACLKAVKTNKMVGAEKTSFLKSCIAAP